MSALPAYSLFELRRKQDHQSLLVLMPARMVTDFNEFLLTNEYTFTVSHKIPSYTSMYAPETLDEAILLVLDYHNSTKEITLHESPTD